MITSIIVAMGTNCCIGVNNDLPWKLSADLKYFKATTMGKPIIMGRKTFESIGRPLPGRTNIVITRSETWSAEGVSVVHSVADAKALADAEGAVEAMIIGGAEIYALALPETDKLYVTEVDMAPEGDAFFPIVSGDWAELSRDSHAAEAEAPAHAFVTYIRD